MLVRSHFFLRNMLNFRVLRCAYQTPLGPLKGEYTVGRANKANAGKEKKFSSQLASTSCSIRLEHRLCAFQVFTNWQAVRLLGLMIPTLEQGTHPICVGEREQSIRMDAASQCVGVVECHPAST
jgi:hypothetical protein